MSITGLELPKAARDEAPPRITTALQVIGGIAIALACIALAYTGVAAASNADRTPLSDWVAEAGALIFGLLLLGVVAVIDKLHRIEVLLARVDSRIASGV